MFRHRPGDVIVVRGRPYQLLGLLASGGQGAVYDATDDQERPVAIKLVPSLPRHRVEAKILASLHSEHVVKLIDAGATRTTLFLVLERVEGLDLKALIRQSREDDRPIPPMIAVQILHQGCLALLEATELGRLEYHGDIKPGNLILDRQGVVKLIDFGTAREYGMPEPEALMGTPENMAPEQVGLHEGWRVDIRTDLYAMGLVLFELLELDTVFQFRPGMPLVERLHTVWHADFEPRLERIEQIHPAPAIFLREALRRDPEERFQSPHEMLSALEGLMKRLPPAPLPLDRFAQWRYALGRREAVPPTIEMPDTRRVA